MSFLWNGIVFLKLLKNKARPSPKHKKYFLKNAYKKSGVLPGRKIYLNKINLPIERTSVPAFFNKKVKAGMTVEAAIVLPIFLFFFLNLSCAIEMIRLHCNLEAALCNTGNKMSVYGSALIGGAAKAEVGTENVEDGMENNEGKKNNKSDNIVIQEAGDIFFSYIYVKNAVIKYEGKDYLDNSPLLYGSDGLQFIESDIFTSQDTFDITMTYAVSPWIDCIGIRPFRMANRYYGHIWNGYDLSNFAKDEEKAETVYIAENASVYHENINCTHLRLTIREVSPGQIGSERNIYGNKYTLCEKCGKGIMPNKLYVGKEGDRYHYSDECPGLKRTVYSMKRAEAEQKYRPCSRCSN